MSAWKGSERMGSGWMLCMLIVVSALPGAAWAVAPGVTAAPGPASQVPLRPGENCGNPIPVDVLPYSTLDSTSHAIDDFPPGPCFNSQAGVGPDLVYRFVSHSALPESVAFYASPRSDWNLALSVMSPSCGPALPCKAASNTAGPGMPELCVVVVQPLQPYYVVVDGVGGQFGQFVLMCTTYGDVCRRLEAPPLEVTARTNSSEPRGQAGGGLYELLNVVFAPCKDQYFNLGNQQYSWARAKRFEDKGERARAEQYIRYYGYYFVDSKYPNRASIPCTCNYEVNGFNRAKSWREMGVGVSRSGIGIYDIQPFFLLQTHGEEKRCETLLESNPDCENNGPWSFSSPLVRQNVPTLKPQKVDISFSTSAVALGNAQAFGTILGFRATIECADPPEDREAISSGGLADRGPPRIHFSGWQMERSVRRATPTVVLPSGFSGTFVPVDTTDHPGGVASVSGFGFPNDVFVTRDGAVAGTGGDPPADTSRILAYANAALSVFGSSPLLAPSALEQDRVGRFGNLLFAACADSFSLPEGTPIRDHGTLIAIDAAGDTTTFARGLSSPVALAFAPLSGWNGNLYIAEKETNAVDQVAPGGTVLGFALNAGTPSDLVFGTGAFGALLYVVDADSISPDTLAHSQAGRILRFSPGGSRSEFVAGLHHPTSIVRAVPAGPFGDYLYVALDNQLDGDGLLIPQTGRVVKIDASGTVTTFADALDQPRDMAFGPAGELFVAVAGGLEVITAGSLGVPGAPTGRTSIAAAPNPFSTKTTIQLRLTARDPLDVSVFDLAGRRVAVLASGHFGPGPLDLAWDGRDAFGRDVPLGLYMVRVRVPGHVETCTVMRVR